MNVDVNGSEGVGHDDFAPMVTSGVFSFSPAATHQRRPAVRPAPQPAGRTATQTRTNRPAAPCRMTPAPGPLSHRSRNAADIPDGFPGFDTLCSQSTTDRKNSSPVHADGADLDGSEV